MVETPENLKQAIRIADLKNISMGIQITPKKEKQVNALDELIAKSTGEKLPFDSERFIEGSLTKNEEYLEVTKNASRYIQIRGMFELKQGFKYSALNKSLNADLNTWKKYETEIVSNR